MSLGGWRLILLETESDWQSFWNEREKKTYYFFFHRFKFSSRFKILEENSGLKNKVSLSYLSG